MTDSHRATLRQLVWIAVIMALVPWGPAAAQGFDTRGKSRFGIVEAYYRPADARDLGVGWERIIFEWAQFQPDSPGEFKTDVIPDAWLWDAQLAGRDVIGLLKNTPYWASGTDKLGAPPTGLDLPLDDPGNYWAAFVRRTVEYYSHKWGIHHWIIYNEPDIRPGDLPSYEFDGGVEDYYRMLKVAYLAAKAVDPQAVIHLAGMAWYVDVTAGRTPFLQRLLEYAAQDADAYDYGFFFDVATVHIYFGTLNAWHVLLDTKRILERHRLQNKDLWVDEANASPSLDPYAPVPGAAYQVDLNQQADYIVQAAALSLAAGVKRFGVYRLFDDHFVPGQSEPWGLVRPDGSRRPAYSAYQTVVKLFSDTREAHWIYSTRSSLVTLETGDRTVYVMWARKTDPVRFHVESSGAEEEATRVTVYGATNRVTGEVLPSVEGRWFVLDVAAALPDPRSDQVLIEGSPVILVVDGPPRAVWIEVQGTQWRLR